MEKYINDIGKEVWRGVEYSDEFSESLFHKVECSYDDDQVAFHSNLGSITILDRMTGFGWRDVETGFRDKEGNFWLASGNFDVRMHSPKTIGDAIDLIKENANTCVPSIK